MFHTESIAISPHRCWGSPNMVEMVHVVSCKDESLLEITVRTHPPNIPHLTFSPKYAARNFPSLLSFKPFHPTSLLFGHESFGWWRSKHGSWSPPPIDSISTVLCKDLCCHRKKRHLPNWTRNGSVEAGFSRVSKNAYVIYFASRSINQAISNQNNENKN